MHIFFFSCRRSGGTDWTGMEDGHMGWRDVQALGVYGGKDFFFFWGVFLYAYERHKAKNTMATLQINYIYHPCIRLMTFCSAPVMFVRRGEMQA